MKASLLLAALVVVSCTPVQQPSSATKDQLRTRASFDLGCPEAQLKITTIDDRTKGVSGCGRRAAYIEQCNHDRFGDAEECTWVANTRSMKSDD